MKNKFCPDCGAQLDDRQEEGLHFWYCVVCGYREPYEIFVPEDEMAFVT